MRFYVEIDTDMLASMDSLVLESCNYNLSGEQVADLRDYLEACGYDWNEVAWVCERVPERDGGVRGGARPPQRHPEGGLDKNGLVEPQINLYTFFT